MYTGVLSTCCLYRTKLENEDGVTELIEFSLPLQSELDHADVKVTDADTRVIGGARPETMNADDIETNSTRST